MTVFESVMVFEFVFAPESLRSRSKEERNSMARKQHHECVECDAVFKINFDLDDDYYKVGFCPFCGAEMGEDQQDEYEEDPE